MYFGELNKTSVVDGPGVRVSLYVSGCNRHCKGCHNPESWSFTWGQVFDEKAKQELFEALNHEYIEGFTFCGGEPWELESQEQVLAIAKEVREKFPNKTIWSWTGYDYEDLLPGGKRHGEFTDELLSLVDVIVVGEFILEQRDITKNNLWRGSRNQRVIDMNETRKQGHKVFLKGVPNND